MHGGNIRSLARVSGLAESQILDFSASINPLGPPEWLRPLISAHLSDMAHYPDPDCTALTEAFCSRWHVAADEVLFGNGSTELLYLIPRAFRRKRAVVTAPAYADYSAACRQGGVSVESCRLREEDAFVLNMDALEGCIGRNDLVFIGSPNNPTGHCVEARALWELAGRYPDALFVIDEAFADFVDGRDRAEHIDRFVSVRPPNVICLGSLTKFYAIPGLRLGFAAAHPGLIASMRGLIPPWSVNGLAQAAGEYAMRDRDYEERSRHYVAVQKALLLERLEKIPGLTVYSGQANFLLVRLDRGNPNAADLAEQLLHKGIAIRLCSNFEGLDGRFFRIAVRTADDNELFCSALEGVLGASTRSACKQRRAASVMLQGTGSNAGKSVLAAALCRILLQDGYHVAPFKAQNMSLNSHVTAGGGEMGRAQVVQAQACRLAPDVRMNPILLKPSSDMGAQVILMGNPVGNMDAASYIRYKPLGYETVIKAYDSLASEYDVIVLEGAGSPAEVNLKHHDIVNMRMAHHAASPVLLVGDIDRGGVFASFVGTMEVLAEWERALVKGFVVNRFRGDKSLLQDALDYTARHTGLPTFGVVPYIHGLGLPEEDSVTFKGSLPEEKQGAADRVRIALIDLPHISNFTDFDPLRLEPDVSLRVVRSVRDLDEHPDALILPGSKNVIGDLRYLYETGLAASITDMAAEGKAEIIGICGGFQFLGGCISDPHGIESAGKPNEDLAFCPSTPCLCRKKS